MDAENNEPPSYEIQSQQGTLHPAIVGGSDSGLDTGDEWLRMVKDDYRRFGFFSHSRIMSFRSIGRLHISFGQVATRTLDGK